MCNRTSSPILNFLNFALTSNERLKAALASKSFLCQEIEITASGSFSTIYSEIEQNFTGIYKRQLIPLNDNALYYREDEGDQGERQWIAHSGDSEVVDPWILSSNKYALPGSDLGTV